MHCDTALVGIQLLMVCEYVKRQVASEHYEDGQQLAVSNRQHLWRSCSPHHDTAKRNTTTSHGTDLCGLS